MEKVDKPWGYFMELYQYDNKKVKILYLDIKSSLSYQSHKHRDEVWFIMNGKGLLTLNGLERKVYEEDVIRINAGDKHRISTDLSTLRILELQIGHYLEEDDIIRYDDQYGREGLFKNFK